MVIGLAAIRPIPTMDYPKFVVKKTKDGLYVFNLYSQETGEVIAKSKPHVTKKACLHSIIAVIRDAPAASIEAATG